MFRFLRGPYRPVTGALRGPRILTIAEIVPGVGFVSAARVGVASGICPAGHAAALDPIVALRRATPQRPTTARKTRKKFSRYACLTGSLRDGYRTVNGTSRTEPKLRDVAGTR